MVLCPNTLFINIEIGFNINFRPTFDSGWSTSGAKLPIVAPETIKAEDKSPSTPKLFENTNVEVINSEQTPPIL